MTDTTPTTGQGASDRPQDPPPPPKKSNQYNQTIWIIPLGITAFVISALLLIGLRFSERRFFEIGVDFKKIEIAGADSLKIRLEKKLSDAQAVKMAAVKTKPADTIRLNKKIDSISGILKMIELRKFELAYRNIDSLSSSVNYNLNKTDLGEALNKFKKDDSVTLQFGYVNTKFSNEPVIVPGIMTTNYFPTSFDFFNHYPNFALWAFLWILQMVVWFIIAGICASLYSRIKALFAGDDRTFRYGLQSDDSRIALRNSIWFSTVPVLLFSVLLYLVIIDKIVVSDDYFMNNFVNKTWAYSTVGYVVAAMCFVGYLYISYLINEMQSKVIKLLAEKKGFEKTKVELGADKKDEIAAIEKQISEIDEKISNMKEGYKIARKYFNLFLIMTAVVLCLSVLFVATLFTSINSMDIFNYYRFMGGGNYLPGDFVYLFGALNSILLLIYFLPVKFNLFSLNLMIPQFAETSDGTVKGNAKQAAISFGKLIGEILIVSSPLLASLLQNLLSSLS